MAAPLGFTDQHLSFPQGTTSSCAPSLDAPRGCLEPDGARRSRPEPQRSLANHVIPEPPTEPPGAGGRGGGHSGPALALTDRAVYQEHKQRLDRREGKLPIGVDSSTPLLCMCGCVSQSREGEGEGEGERGRLNFLRVCSFSPTFP